MFCRKIKKERDYYKERLKETQKHYFDLLLTIREHFLIYKKDSEFKKEIRLLCEEAVGWVSLLDVYEMDRVEIYAHIMRLKSFYDLEHWAPLSDWNKKEKGK